MGTFGMFTTNLDYEIQKPTSQFFASQLINTEWVQPGNGVHKTYSAASDLFDAAGHSLVTAYALLRPDSRSPLAAHNTNGIRPTRVVSRTRMARLLGPR
jgi:hypothetical protein